MDFIELAWRPPADAFNPLKSENGALLLETPEQASVQRWSFICAFPKSEFSIKGDKCFIDGVVQSEDPLLLLENFFKARPVVDLQFDVDAPPFVSGIAGYIGYDAAHLFIPSIKMRSSPYILPDIRLMDYNAVACFDHVRSILRVYGLCSAAREKLGASLGMGDSLEEVIEVDTVQSNLSKEEYLTKITDIKSRIKEGDIYQANFSQVFELKFKGRSSSFDVYNQLRCDSSSPYLAMLSYDDGVIISNSPERFFRIMPVADGRKIITEPIKGTRPRGSNAQEDGYLRKTLSGDKKERAENIMIADLMRNDLSKICKDHTICEEEVCAVKSFTRVHHLVSKITGYLRDDIGWSEVLAALFPSGSITGAPKIESMKVIAELESHGRGPYCGTIGYFSDSGFADWSVAIRVLIFSNLHSNVCRIAAGGGITYLSDPEAEYAETKVKAISTFPTFKDGVSNN